MGPEGGKCGGEILFTGTPEELAACDKGYTARFLKQELYAQPNFEYSRESK
jgi:excinuclease ABC subunit A